MRYNLGKRPTIIIEGLGYGAVLANFFEEFSLNHDY